MSTAPRETVPSEKHWLVRHAETDPLGSYGNLNALEQTISFMLHGAMRATLDCKYTEEDYRKLAQAAKEADRIARQRRKESASIANEPAFSEATERSWSEYNEVSAPEN